MPRAFRLYYQLLSLGFLLAGAGLWAARQDDAFSWSLDLIRFVLGAALLGTAAATWAAAIAIAYVHRVTWPILVLVGMVVIAGGGFALWCHQHAALAARFT